MPATPQTRERPLNRRYAHAIGLLIDGTASTQTQAAKLANVRRDELSRILKTDKAQRFIQEQCSRYLKGVPAIKAAATLARLTTARSEDVSARVSQKIAEHAGILIPHASPQLGLASPVPLLSIVFRSENGGSSVAVGVQLEGQAQEMRDISTPSIAAPVPAKEAGTGEGK